MATARRPDFNRDKDFSVAKQLPGNRSELLVGSSRFLPGEAFDKSVVNTRLLRQLYDTRWLVFVDDEKSSVAPLPVARVRRRR